MVCIEDHTANRAPARLSWRPTPVRVPVERDHRFRWKVITRIQWNVITVSGRS